MGVAGEDSQVVRFGVGVGGGTGADEGVVVVGGGGQHAARGVQVTGDSGSQFVPVGGDRRLPGPGERLRWGGVGVGDSEDDVVVR